MTLTITDNNTGFTLFETLVAMMVLAISLAVLFQLFSGGLKSARVSDDTTRAVFYAREKIEEILLSESLVDGIAEGVCDDRYRWKAEIEAEEVEGEKTEGKKQKPAPSPLTLFRITVDVRWNDGEHEKHVEMTTRQLAKPMTDH